ncbi:MAG: peptidoglycan editing factor PgeF [Candidatus Sericytochromatia bacterium]|nr:peptidoglycan editing factor PgeF [Candidatus Sericytochromatia bacterium]
MLEFEKINNLDVLKSNKMKKLSWLQHGFTTRIGGISLGAFDSLNLYGNDLEEFNNSLQNRRILAKELGFNHQNIVLAQQVHGKKVHVVKAEDIGRGALNHQQAIPSTDALVTNISGIPIMLLYADCFPILIADIKNKAVGVVHAGWKGTAQSIIIETLQTMIDEYNSKKENLIISFGIGISKKNFEIGEDAKNKLSLVSFSNDCFEIKENKIFADLIEINKSQALKFGIPEDNIDYNKELCTYDDNKWFYSYRKDNKITGRHGALIFIKEV